jgi:O-antigen/teichoic acid export membrane protein
MGVDRGVLQGVGAYFWLSAAYLLEGLVRLGIGVLLGYALLTVGRSLEGAVWGFVESMLATWFVSWLAVRHFRTGETHSANSASQRREWLQLGRMTALVLIGQALITNSDFLLVKNFFSSEDAGLYAAVSVLGRIVYFGALPLTILLVPLIARRQALNDPTRPILMMLIGGGAVICGLLIGGAVFFGDRVLSLLYGEAYFPGAALLAPYALAASLYTLTNLVITYQIALGSGGETWMPILAGSAQITGVLLFHDSLEQVILVQIVLMGLLFAIVLWRVLREPRTPPEADDEARVAESS